MRWPIKCYGRTFSRGYELTDFATELYTRSITLNDWLIISYTYDNGYLNHPDFKYLKRKFEQEQRNGNKRAMR